jgi:hypothetical protein
MALMLAACGRTAAQPSATQPAELAGLFPQGASIVSQPLGSGMAVLVSMPGQAATASASAPPSAELAIVDKTGSGWRVAKAVIQDFAQAPKLDSAQVAGMPAVGLNYHTGANSQGMVVVRNSAVVLDAVADSVQFEDVDQDGSAEVVKAWSPFCQSHAASPRLETVYAWSDGAYVPATGGYPAVLARDTASFQAAVTRAGSSQTTPVWTARDRACLHDSLAYLAGLAGNTSEASAQYAQVQALDASYDPQTIAKQAAGR